MWLRPQPTALALVAVVACGPPLGSGPTGEPVPDPLQDTEARELFERGVALARQGDHLRAEQYLTSAMDRGYDEREAMPILLRVCVSSSRLATAIRYAEPYLANHPDDWPLRYLLASFHLGVGQLEEAQAHLERILDQEPAAAEPHYLLGVTLLRRSVEHEGREHLRRYLELDPEGAFADEVRGMLAEPERAMISLRPADSPAEEPRPAEPGTDGAPAAGAAESGGDS